MLPTPSPVNSSCSEMPIVRSARRPVRASVVELDVFFENDRAVVVAHDVVAVQAVAVLVEVESAFGARETFCAKDCLTDRFRIRALGLVYRAREQRHRVVGP